MALPVPAGGGVQLVQALPQCVGSVLMSKHVVVVPHLEKPLWQVKPQVELEQVAVACAGATHSVPQLPQLFGSEGRLTHWPSQFVVPPVQLSVQEPLEQTCPVEHRVVQSPQ